MPYMPYFGVVSQGVAQTTTPDIVNYSTSYIEPYYIAHWKVQNLDSSTATLYSEVGDSTPDLNVDTDIASEALGASHSKSSASNGFTIYATAQASGKLLSNYTSQYTEW